MSIPVPHPPTHPPAHALDRVVLEAAWFGSASLRSSAHRAIGDRGCPARGVPYLSGRGSEQCATSECVGILDEVYLTALHKLGQSHPEVMRSRRAYVRRVVVTVVSDLERRARTARGAPSRPIRDDGPARRVNLAIEQATPDPVVRGWRLALFRLMRSWVHREARTLAGWPLEAWTAEKCAVDGLARGIGSRRSGREILTDVGLVIDLATSVNGPEWVMTTLLRPLQLVAASPLDDELAPASPCVDPVDAYWAAEVARQFTRRRAGGDDAEAAWQGAVRCVVGVAPARSVRGVLDDLEPQTGPGALVG